ncbi:MAG: hypothetical protein ACK4UN_19395, partial [Limisphaerales bacterium]
MSTYNAFYVRKQAPDDVTRAEILKLYPDAHVETLPDFIGAVLSRNEYTPAEEALSQLSEKLDTDIIWVGYQTAVEAFVYHHWRVGTQLRALRYGCASEGTWDRVEGEVEPWERDAFWNDGDLDGWLEDAETENERQKLRKLWKDCRLVQGETVPMAGSDAAVEVVMEHYGLFDTNGS